MCKMVPLENGRLVADIKYRHIRNISREARKCKNISRIILFGSSTEERCTKRSDIDIAVFGKQTKTKYLRSREYMKFRHNLFQYDMDQDYDILYFEDGKRNNDQIMEEINKGVELYRSISDGTN